MPNLNLPCAVGPPKSNPDASSESPGGKVEPVATDHVYGDVPPDAANCSLYGVTGVVKIPLGKGDVVVIASVLITIESGPEVATSPAASVSETVKFEAPSVVGLPTTFTVPVVLPSS